MAKDKDSRKLANCKICGKEFRREDRRQLLCSKNCLRQKHLITGKKNRVYKTCACGFVGYGPVQFPANAKGKCHVCWKACRNDCWNKWSKQEVNHFLKKQRRIAKERTMPWDKWALRKSTNLVARLPNGCRKKREPRSITNWNDCLSIGLIRIKQQAKDQVTDRWNRKCSSWAKSLVTREKQQGVKRFAS